MIPVLIGVTAFHHKPPDSKSSICKVFTPDVMSAPGSVWWRFSDLENESETWWSDAAVSDLTAATLKG